MAILDSGCDRGARTIVVTSVGRGRTDSVHIHSTRCALDPSVPAQSTAGLSTFACRRRRQRRWHRSFPHVRIHSIDTRVSHRSFQTQGSSVAQTQPANVGIIRRATCERFLPTVRSSAQAETQIPSLPFSAFQHRSVLVITIVPVFFD